MTSHTQAEKLPAQATLTTPRAQRRTTSASQAKTYGLPHEHWCSDQFSGVGLGWSGQFARELVGMRGWGSALLHVVVRICPVRIFECQRTVVRRNASSFLCAGGRMKGRGVKGLRHKVLEIPCTEYYLGILDYRTFLSDRQLSITLELRFYLTIMDDFYLFANCNFVPDKYNDVCLSTTKPPSPSILTPQLFLSSS